VQPAWVLTPRQKNVGARAEAMEETEGRAD
jgi:hypothetical protein